MNVSRNLFLAALVAVSFPVLADDLQVEQPTTEISSVKVEVPSVKVEVAAAGVKAPGFGSRVGSALKWPFVTVATGTTAGASWFVNNAGGARVARYLSTAKEGSEAGKIVSFFKEHAVGTARVVALLEVALIFAAACKAYETFIVSQDDDAQDYDFGVFGDNDADFAVEPEDVQ